MIINAGIKKLIFDDGYPDQLAAEMIKESGLEVVQYRKSTEEGGKVGG
jgi:dCMP deaminase